MKALWIVALVFWLAQAANAQSVTMQAAAGPTLVDRGHQVSASLGVSALSRVTFLVNIERTQILSRIAHTGGVRSARRGGTLTAVSGEVRSCCRGARRVMPYVLAGLGAGTTKQNVNEDFTGSASTHEARFVFFGGGVDVSLRERLSLFGDVRLLFGEEEGEILGLIPVRVGIAWHF